MKIAVLTVISLLLGANAFAAPKNADVIKVAQMLSPVVKEAGSITIGTGGQKVASLSLAKQPIGAGVYLICNSIFYDNQSKIITLKGKFSIGVRREGKTLWQMSVADGTGTITPRPKAAPAAPKEAAPQTPSIPQDAGLIAIEVGGQKVATVALEKQPKDAKVLVTSDGAVTYDDNAHIATLKGKFTVEVRQQSRLLWDISVDDGIGTIQLPLSKTQLPTPRNG